LTKLGLSAVCGGLLLSESLPRRENRRIMELDLLDSSYGAEVPGIVVSPGCCESDLFPLRENVRESVRRIDDERLTGGRELDAAVAPP
jgi:hypothetical protein